MLGLKTSRFDAGIQVLPSALDNILRLVLISLLLILS